MTKTQRNFWIFCILSLLLLAITGVAAGDKPTWALETFPIMIALPLLFFTFRRFPLSPLLYILIFLHFCLLAYGGTYTYAKTPFGYWLQDIFHTERNPFDRLGHFVQGFVPALIAREIFIRQQVIRGRKMLFFLIVCVCLAISAFYELIEWWVALASGQGATAFLGTQGDVWDTQWDMFTALIGAVVAQIVLSRVQDKQIAKL
jgi:putative membrane protein